MPNKANKPNQNDDIIVAYLKEHNLPLTLENFVLVNWLGDKTVSDLTGEDFDEIPEMFNEDGEIVN